jgi:hypothetical protein
MIVQKIELTLIRCKIHWVKLSPCSHAKREKINRVLKNRPTPIPGFIMYPGEFKVRASITGTQWQSLPRWEPETVKFNMHNLGA